jgi:hypothetical protein
MYPSREDTLIKEFDPVLNDCTTKEEDLQLAITLNPSLDKIKNAMDQHATNFCMELLEYMAENNVDCSKTWKGKPENKDFYYKGQWITKEALFENFL